MRYRATCIRRPRFEAAKNPENRSGWLCRIAARRRNGRALTAAAVPNGLDRPTLNRPQAASTRAKVTATQTAMVRRFMVDPVLVRGRARLTCDEFAPGRFQWQWRRAEDDLLVARQRQPELGALPRTPPGLQPAVVQPGVLQRDGQPETGAAHDAIAALVRTPEAPEDLVGLFRLETHPVVAHGQRHGRRSPATEGDLPVFAVADGVAEQVADDALHLRRPPDHGARNAVRA